MGEDVIRRWCRECLAKLAYRSALKHPTPKTIDAAYWKTVDCLNSLPPKPSFRRFDMEARARQLRVMNSQVSISVKRLQKVSL